MAKNRPEEIVLEEPQRQQQAVDRPEEIVVQEAQQATDRPEEIVLEETPGSSPEAPFDPSDHSADWNWGEQVLVNLAQDWNNLTSSTKQLYLQAIGEDPEKQKQVKEQIVRDRVATEKQLGDDKSASAEFVADVIPYLIPFGSPVKAAKGVFSSAVRKGVPRKAVIPQAAGRQSAEMATVGALKGGAEQAGGDTSDIIKGAGKTAAIDALIPQASKYIKPAKTSEAGFSPARVHTSKAVGAGVDKVSKSAPVESLRSGIRSAAESRVAESGIGAAEKVTGGWLGGQARYVQSQIKQTPITSAAVLTATSGMGGMPGLGVGTAGLWAANRTRTVREAIVNNSRKIPQKWRRTLKQAAASGDDSLAAALYVGQQQDSEMRKMMEELGKEERPDEIVVDQNDRPDEIRLD